MNCKIDGHKIDEPFLGFDCQFKATKKMQPGDPIMFGITKIDMQKIMYQFENVLKGYIDKDQIQSIRDDFQRKIDWHEKNGEWI